MAVVGVTVSVQDGKGKTSAFHVKTPAGPTAAQLLAYAQRLAERIDAICDGKIVGIEYTTQVALPGGLKADPVATSDVEEGGLFSFNCTGTVYSDSVRIPAFKETLFAGEEINIADTDVADFIALMVSGESLASATIQASNPFENDFASLKRTLKSFRR